MVKKWEVVAAPSDKNPARHKLLIKGEMKDIFLIVKKLSGVCSRPEKASGDFNFMLYLAKLEVDTMSKLKEIMGELERGAARAKPKTAAPETALELFEPPKRKLKIEPDTKSAPVAAKPSASAEPGALPPAVEPAGAAGRPRPAGSQARETSPAHVSPSMNFMPSETARIKKEESARIKAASEQKTQAAAPASPAAPVSSKLKTRWSIELPLVPTHSFQTLVAGSHNRFAHAAAMAVVENPGVIYNPLLIFGMPGTGKTHFVHSVSYGLSASVGQNNIFVTDGIKLSKGVEMAIKEGTVAKFDGMFSKIKALIIDDVHLLMISPSNKKYISKWLNDFVAQDKQIMLTSVFPPKALSGLEETVGFQFTQGWMVDLKAPTAASYKLILNQLLQGMDIKLSEDEINTIFKQEKNMSFGEIMKVLENMKKLEKLTINATNISSHAQLLDMLLGIGEIAVSGTLTDAEYSASQKWSQSETSTWFKWGIFYPKGMKREAQFVLYKMHERAGGLGLRAEWTQVFMEEYNPDETYGIPFKIGNYAAQVRVNGVIVLGPQPSSALGAQEAEFRHITFKILDSYLLKGAWIPVDRLKSQSVYTKMLMDLI